MKTVKLENWAVCFLPQDAWGATLADCDVPGRLTGNVFGHSNIRDGEIVTTTPMVKTEGRLITTHSGTVYELGKAKDDYVKFVHSMPGKEDWDFDGDNPVVLHGEDVSKEKRVELDREQERVKDTVRDELELAIMPTPATKH